MIHIAALFLFAPTAVPQDDLFVSSFSPGLVELFDGSTGDAEGVLAKVGFAAGVAFAPNGNLLVASSGLNSVLELDPVCGDVVRTFTGGGLSLPRDILLGPNGNLFVASRGSDVVLEFDGSTGAALGTFASAGLDGPTGLAFGASGNLFVASVDNDRVLEFDGVTGALIRTVAMGGGLDGPAGLLFRPNGNLLVSSSFTDEVLEYDTPSATLLGTFAAGNGLDNPSGMTFDTAGRLLVCSNASGEVLRFNGADGTFLDAFAQPAAPWDLAFGSRTLPVVPGFTVSVHAALPLPFGLSFAPSGDLFVGRQTEPATGVFAFVSRVQSDGQVLPYGASATLDPDTVVFDGVGAVSGVPGSVIVAGICGSSCFHRIEPDESVALLLGPIGLPVNPYDMELDTQGRVIVTDDNSNALYVLTAAGISTLAGLPSPSFGLAIDGLGRIYTSAANGTVSTHAESGALLDPAFATSLGSGPALAIGPGGSWGTDLYALDLSAGALLRLDPQGVPTVIGSGFADTPSDLAFGPDGALYVSQVCTDRVLRIEPGSAPLMYCSAKASSAGCVTMISTSTPSQPISGASDYSVLATQVQELKAGLLFGAVNGPASLPFSGGLLCVQPPLKRGPLRFSGGDVPSQCDGAFGTLVNDGAVLPAGLDAGPGNSGWYQYWYRDPQNGAGTLGTALSNAVRLDFE